MCGDYYLYRIPRKKRMGRALLFAFAFVLISLCGFAHGKYAFGTVLYSDSYLVPLLTLGQSINNTGTAADRVAMYTSDVSERTVQTLQQFGWRTVPTEVLISTTNTPLYSRYAKTFTKIRMWQLVDYEKVIYLDADVIVLKNMDELFECPYFCAPIDQMPNKGFCAGTMVLTPSLETYQALLKAMDEPHPEDQLADQDLFNRFFPVSKMTSEQLLSQKASFQTAPYLFYNFYYKQIEHDILSIHYTLGKPWFWHNYPFTDLSWKWRAVYVTLPLRVTAGEVLWYAFMLVTPALVIFCVVRHLRPRGSKATTGGAKTLLEELPNEKCIWTPRSFMQVLGLVVGTATGGISAYMLIPDHTFFMLGWLIFHLWVWMGIIVFVLPIARYQLGEQWHSLEYPLRRAAYYLVLDALFPVLCYCAYVVACLRYIDYLILRHVVLFLVATIYLVFQLFLFSLRPHVCAPSAERVIAAMISKEEQQQPNSARRDSEAQLSARALSARGKWNSMRPPLY